MFDKYPRFCCAENTNNANNTNTRFVPACCPIRPSKAAAIPESVRSRTALCTPYIAPSRSSATCIPGGEEGGNPGTANVGTPGTDAPVEVKTRSAGEYQSLLGIQVLSAANNPFTTDPDARFKQYFPPSIPAPLSVTCPERYDNPAPIRDRGCIPQGVFATSVPGGPIA